MLDEQRTLTTREEKHINVVIHEVQLPPLFISLFLFFIFPCISFFDCYHLQSRLLLYNENEHQQCSKPHTWGQNVWQLWVERVRRLWRKRKPYIPSTRLTPDTQSRVTVDCYICPELRPAYARTGWPHPHLVARRTITSLALKGSFLLH